MQSLSGSPQLTRTASPVDLDAKAEPVAPKPHRGSDGLYREVDVVVVGAGPLGLLTASQLHGTTFIHGKSASCTVKCHSEIANGQSVHLDEIPDLAELSDRGQIRCGNWFDRFLFTKLSEPEICLRSRYEPGCRAQTLLIGNSLAGGSWNFYHPSQSSASPYTWMGLPDYPITPWVAKTNESLISTPETDRSKVSSKTLCRYFADYTKRPEFLFEEQMLLNHKVERATPQKGGGWEVCYSGVPEVLKGNTVHCDYLVVACGHTKHRQLGVPGEQEFSCTRCTGFHNPNLYVTHSTSEARSKLETMKPGGRVLLIGKGMSSSDVIDQAKKGGHRVTHLIPERNYPNNPVSSCHVLERLKGRDKDFPAQAQAYRLIHNPDSDPDFYEQKKLWSLETIEQNQCVLKGPEGQSLKEKFDLVSIVIGSEADFSFLDIDKQQRETLLESVSPDTMEAGIPNLFIVGMAAGEPFQRFSFGHTVAAAETIKNRLLKDAG